MKIGIIIVMFHVEHEAVWNMHGCMNGERMWIRERTTWIAERVWMDTRKRVAEGVRSVYVDCTRLWGGCEGMRSENEDKGNVQRGWEMWGKD